MSVDLYWSLVNSFILSSYFFFFFSFLLWFFLFFFFFGPQRQFERISVDLCSFVVNAFVLFSLCCFLFFLFARSSGLKKCWWAVEKRGEEFSPKWAKWVENSSPFFYPLPPFIPVSILNYFIHKIWRSPVNFFSCFWFISKPITGWK